MCHCSSGSQGQACELPQVWECNAADGRYIWTRCAGACDTRYGHCHCGARGVYPQRPLLQCEPRGIERVIKPWKLTPVNNEEKYDWRAIWARGCVATVKALGH